MEAFALRFADEKNHIFHEIYFDKKPLVVNFHFGSLLQLLSPYFQKEQKWNILFEDEFSEYNIISTEIEWNTFLEYISNTTSVNNTAIVHCVPHSFCKSFIKQKLKDLRRSRRKQKQLTPEQIERRRQKRLAKLERRQHKDINKKFEWETNWINLFYPAIEKPNQHPFHLLLDMNNILLELQLFRNIILNEKSNTQQMIESLMVRLCEQWILKHENQIQHMLLFFDLGFVTSYSKHQKIVVESVKPLFQTSDDAIVNTVQRLISHCKSSSSGTTIVVTTSDHGLKKRIKQLAKESTNVKVYFMSSLHFLQGFVSELQSQQQQPLLEQISSLTKEQLEVFLQHQMAQ